MGKKKLMLIGLPIEYARKLTVGAAQLNSCAYGLVIFHVIHISNFK